MNENASDAFSILDDMTCGVVEIKNGSVVFRNTQFASYVQLNTENGGMAFEPYILALTQASKKVRESIHRFMIAIGLFVEITFKQKSSQRFIVLVKDISKEVALEDELKLKSSVVTETFKHLEDEKKKNKERITTSIATMSLPYISKLRENADESAMKLLDILEYSISSTHDSFTLNTIKYLSNLSKKEMEVCNLIKFGQSTKDIALALKTSHKTIETHRKNIRKKLNIHNQSINLVSYLKTLSVD